MFFLSAFRNCLCRYAGPGWAPKSVQYSNGVDSRIGIIGVPFDRGQKINTDIHEGPKAIREGGLVCELTSFNGMLRNLIKTRV